MMTSFLIYLAQITFILTIVLLLGKIVAKQAAKAHAILLAGIVMTVALPVFSFVANEMGIGLLPAKQIGTTTTSNIFVGESPELPEVFPQSIDGVHPTLIAQYDALEKEVASGDSSTKEAAGISSIANRPTLWQTATKMARGLNWLWILAVVWLGCSIRILFQLVVGSNSAFSVRKSGMPVTDQRLIRALATAKKVVGIEQDVRLTASEKASCPMIWCWSKPTIIIPAHVVGNEQGENTDWKSVFCHELAHLARRDHLSSVAADISRLVLPWHPLVQIVRRHLHRYSELACDNWALQVSDPADYAESILNFAPTPALPLLTPMATHPHELKQRVLLILSLGKRQPRVGQIWLSLLVVLSLTLASLTALVSANSLVVTAPPMTAQQKDDWVQKLKNTNENSPWHVGYNFGMELARLPDGQAYQILDAAWNDIPGSVRAQILKGFLPAFQKSPELNPRLYDVLHLGMVSKQENVRDAAKTYLSWMTLHEFESRSQEYKQWRKSNDGKSPEEITRRECKRLVAEIAEMKKTSTIRRNLKLITEANSNIDNLPLMKESLAEAGLPDLLKKLINDDVINKRHPLVATYTNIESDSGLAAEDEAILRELISIPDDARWFVGANYGKMLAGLPGDRALAILTAAWNDIPANARPQILKGFQPWMLRDGTISDAYFDVMDLAIQSGTEKDNSFAIVYVGSMVFRDFEVDYYHQWRASTMGKSVEEILDMESARFVQSLDGLSGVDAINAMKLLSNGAANVRELPMLRASFEKAGMTERLQEFVKNNPGSDSEKIAETISALIAGKKANTDELNAEFVGIPAVERKIDGNDKKYYYQIGPSKSAKQPAEGWKVLLILPGGDGSADFHPFCRRIHKFALPEGYVVAQLVAPKWSDSPNRVVWPTKSLNPDKAQFTTEKFIKDVVADLKDQVDIDESQVYALGWSSSGPALYANSTAKNSPVKGSFIAMSIFRPQLMGDLKNAKGHSFYLFHSSGDTMIPIDVHAKVAKRELAKAGAKTTLKQYKGGHGWTDDPIGNIKRGVKWLEENN